MRSRGKFHFQMNVCSKVKLDLKETYRWDTVRTWVYNSFPEAIQHPCRFP